MAESHEILEPRSGGKSFVNWTDQEIEDFGNAFSLSDFQIMNPNQEGQEGYVKVTVPVSAEAILRESLENAQRTSFAYQNPLDPQSRQAISNFIGESANALNMSEEEEASHIQTVGRYMEFSDLMEDDQEGSAALQDLRGSIKDLTRRTNTAHVKGVLTLAATFGWENYMDKFRKKYEKPSDVPSEVEAEILSEHERYQSIVGLIDRDVFSGQTPRFQVVSSTGQEIFRSIPVLD